MVLTVAIVIVLLLAATAALLVARGARRRMHVVPALRRAPPPLLVGVHTDVPRGPFIPGRAASKAAAGAAGRAPPLRRTSSSLRPTPASTGGHTVGLPSVSVSNARVDPVATVRVYRPSEDAVHILPGRLDVIEGDAAREIRFVRTWAEVPEVTIGRGAGPKYRHVQLRSPTVSRAHARFRFEGERWKITNLSETNPTVVNGSALAPGERRLLDHGDRVELGEVVLRFWEQ